LTGENVKPELSIWQIIIPDVWSDDEDTMLNSIVVKKVK
jgi:hypothetical protein